jgi:pimeloyl-ACP methyl ester carboxylesterase
MPASTPAAFDLDQLTEPQIVALLANGDSVPLRAYFGDPLFDELRELAERAVKLRVTGKHRVYILPGIMGSTLRVDATRRQAGSRASGTDVPNSRKIWLDPQAIEQGALLSLALPSKPEPQAIAVMLPAYLKLKLHLMLAGFDAVFHPFDWRKSTVAAGKSLLQRIAKDRAKHVSIVGHSLGGLVARAALTADRQHRIARVVQLGAPNYGSYSMVQVLRGVYPTVRKVAALDPVHSVDQLVRHVFRTLPSFYELLPAPEHRTDLDLMNLEHWPGDLLGPDATLLKAAAKARLQWSSAQEHCFHIIGVNQETTTHVRASQHGLEYGLTHDGDGTVSRALADWPDATTYFVEDRHGALSCNTTVCLAVADLLKEGRTRRLPSEWRPSTHQTIKWISDKELRDGSGRLGKVDWRALPIDERRRILEPAISPVFRALANQLGVEAHGPVASADR